MGFRELSWRDRGRLWLRMLIRTALTVAVLLLLFLAGPPLLSLFMPFVLALLFAWLLNPIIRFLQKRVGGSRKVFSFVLVLFILGGVGAVLFALGYSIVTELVHLANNWGAIWVELEQVGIQFMGLFNVVLEHMPGAISAWILSLADRFLDWLQTGLPGLLSQVASQAGNVAMGVPSFTVALVVFVVGAYFISADYPYLRCMTAECMSPQIRSFLSRVRRTAGSAFGGYVRAQLILSAGVFVILLAGFLVTRQPYAVLLALLLSVLDFIPIVGAGTVMVPWAAVALFTRDYRWAAVLLITWGVTALFRRVGEPKVLGSQTGLSPILSLVSIYVGMRLAGVLGMVLGPILCLVVINVCRSGVFDGLMADLRLAARDTAALLHNRTLFDDGPEEPPLGGDGDDALP